MKALTSVADILLAQKSVSNVGLLAAGGPPQQHVRLRLCGAFDVWTGQQLRGGAWQAGVAEPVGPASNGKLLMKWLASGL